MFYPSKKAAVFCEKVRVVKIFLKYYNFRCEFFRKLASNK